MTKRLLQLFLGLGLYGFSMALMVRAVLGLDPWDVFHLGVSLKIGWSFGTVVNVVGAFVLLLWLPLRQRPGIGTVANILVIGTVADLSLAVLPQLDEIAVRWTVMAIGIVLNGIAGAAYIGAGLGPGPRDGLMTGIVRRTGWPVWRVRTGIELAVLACGWMLGGVVGVGTIIYAVAIGPLVQLFLPMFSFASSVKQAGMPASDELQAEN